MHKSVLLPIVAALLSAVALLTAGCSDNTGERPPNIIVILADDLGYGDIGCYGNTVNRTPAIDELAAGGMLFTDYHANGTTCTPTRAALLTGMYQYRFGRDLEKPLNPKTQYDKGLPAQAVTLAEALKAEGYATGMYGKWHLGHHPPMVPAEQGFDDFRGLLTGDGDHHSHIDRQGQEDWWHNDSLAMEEGYSVDLITRHSLGFIRANREKPFFLYVAHLAVHFPWQGPRDPAHRQKGTDYGDDKWGIISDRSNVSPHMKAMIEAVDGSVGTITSLLEELGLEDNTLVIFTSDNGGYFEYPDDKGTFRNISDNGPLRGEKSDVYEGGHRVPFIASWPGRIKPGQRNTSLVMTMDLMPTFLRLAGADASGRFQFDGTDISSALLSGARLPDRRVFWRHQDQLAVRQGAWKLVRNGNENGTYELYDLEHDIGERTDLSDRYPGRVREMAAWYGRQSSEMSAYAERWRKPAETGAESFGDAEGKGAENFKNVREIQ